MCIRTIAFLACALFFSIDCLHAQSPNYTPQAPNAASLGRFGEHPANYFTGIPSISIPLYEIDAGATKLPISLNYHAAGIRVTDMASWVGLGWALSAGPTITRAVVGRPDENDGVLNRPLDTTLNNNLTPPSECVNDEFIYRQYFNAEYDTGYDLFTYTLPGGKTGQFILKEDNTVTPAAMVSLFPGERIKITYTRSGAGVLSFVLTDEEGIRYTFDQQELTTVFSSVAPIQAYTTTWYASEILYQKNNNRIRFGYTNSTFNGYSDFIDRIQVNTDMSGTCNTVPLGVTSSSRDEQYSSFSALLLSEIIFPGGRLTFNPGSNRLDVPGTNTTPALDKIDLYGLTTSNTYQLIKSFDLAQSYFTADQGLGQLRLDGLTMKDADGADVGNYQCAYNTSMNMPGYLSHKRDVWGFYNGTNNSSTSSMVPYQPVTLYNFGSPSTIYVGEADRSSSESYMKVGVLTQLTYPTHGYSKFTYEANRYYDATTSTTALAGGLRIAKIETQASASEPVRVKTYRYGESESGYGVLNTNLSPADWATTYTEYIAPYCGITKMEFTSYYNGVLTPADGSPVKYKEVAEYEGTPAQVQANGRTVYRFRLSEDLQYEVAASSGKRYTINYQWDRGQIESKTVYSQTGTTPVYQLVNTWERIAAPAVYNIALQVANPSRYASSWRDVNYADDVCIPLKGYLGPQFYAWAVATLRLKKADEYQNGSTVPTSTTYTYNGNYQVQKQEVVATDGTVDVKEFRYPHDFNIPTNPSGTVQAIKLLQDNHQRNTILEESGYKRSNASETNPIMTSGKLTLYKEWTNLSGQAFPEKILDLQVLDNSARKNDFLPLSITGASSIASDSRYTNAVTFTNYDADANPTNYTLRNGLATELNWQTLTGSSGNRFSVVSQETTNVGTANSLTTQYTQEVPLVGLKAMTDPKGMVTRYEYDRFGRLHAIKDHYSNILKTFDYNFGCSNCNGYPSKQLSLTVPDLTPILYARPFVTYGVTNITVVVDVVETQGLNAQGLITIYLTRDAAITLTMPPLATTVGGRSVTNEAWTFDDQSNPDYYILTSNQAIAGASNLSFGLSGTLNPSATTGILTISSVVYPGSGGEANFANNTDSDKIEFYP